MKAIQIGALKTAAIISALVPAAASANSWDPGSLGVFGLPSGTIYGIIANAVSWLLGIFGFIGIIGFVISGILYLTAAGSAEQEKTAKKAMFMSIIGVIVGLSGMVIIYAADLALNARTGF